MSKEKAIQAALSEADKKWSLGLLIAQNHPNYDELMGQPFTDEGDRETVFSIASLYSEGNDEWEDAILGILFENYQSFF